VPATKTAVQLEEVIKLLPPGADDAKARLTLGTLVIFWQHVPAGTPAVLQPRSISAKAATDLVRKIAGIVLRNPDGADPRAQARKLIAAGMLGERAKRAALYTVLLRIWTDAGGKLTTGTAKTGSKCAQYLAAAVGAVTGEPFSIGAARVVIRKHGPPSGIS
jgi:hypothetical protein